jgi:hypothetical protein
VRPAALLQRASALALVTALAACSSSSGGGVTPSGGGDGGDGATSSGDGTGGGESTGGPSGGTGGGAVACDNEMYAPKDGTVVWARKMTCGQPVGAARSPDGATIGVGFTAVGAPTLYANGLLDFAAAGSDNVVASMRRDGMFTWFASITGNAEVTKVAAANDGGVAGAGWFDVKATIGGVDVTSTDDTISEGFVARYDGSATAATVATFAAPSGVQWSDVYSLSFDAAGLLTIGGAAEGGVMHVGSLSLAPPSPSSYSALLASFDSSGQAIWGARFGDAASVQTVAAGAGGVVYTLGSFEEGLDLGGGFTAQGTARALPFLAAFDATGAPLWLQTFSKAVVAVDLQVDDAGEAFLFATVSGEADFGDGASEPVGASDVAIAKYAADGTLAWVERYDAEGIVGAAAFAVTSDGRAIVAEPHASDLRLRTLGADGTFAHPTRVFPGFATVSTLTPLTTGDVLLVGGFTRALTLGSLALTTRTSGSYLAVVTP